MDSSWWGGQFKGGGGSSWDRGKSNIHGEGGQFMVGWKIHGEVNSSWWGWAVQGGRKVVHGIGEKDSNIHGGVDSSWWGVQFMVGWTIHGGDGQVMVG